eukprot:TRINITY_DN9190_c0_g1_i1.p1 TRINITY_DN9190_c0_g1~~TRINITY_DN9190_c0_g1_i1.p1  ORF type:complete len:670 (+),score=333.75 TRINITY_DN9190_c0_g1_i1:147-2012(+)
MAAGVAGAKTVKLEAGQEQDKTSWLDVPLHKSIRHAVAECGWVMPTPVQCRAIPAALDGYDLCCRAVTGSGKTGAFLLPILQSFFERSSDKFQKQCIRYVVILPTRELAVQCFNTLEQLAQGISIGKCLVIGGLNIATQQRELRDRPDAVVATPGRLIDSLRNAQGVSLEGLEILVLDEADRLLSLGFRDQVEELLRFCPKKRQTLLLSATMTQEVNELATLSLEKPMNIDVGHVAVSQNLTQEFVRLPQEEEDRARLPLLVCLCSHEFKRGVIIFCKSKSRAQRVNVLLQLCGVHSDELHQEKTQTERLEALDKFRNRTISVLVTTEVAARGLDIDGVRTVINYDLPSDITGYVHRVGRTARIGKSGRSVSFVGQQDTELLKKVVKLSKISQKEGTGSDESRIRKRVVPQDRVVEAQERIDELGEKIRERVDQQRLNRELNNAERKLDKQRNTITHAEEIKSRPRATWFVTEKEKKVSKKRAREELEAEATRDLEGYEVGEDAFHAVKKKAGEYGSKRARLEDKAEEMAQAEVKPKSDKYGKLYQPQKFEKHRGKSIKKGNRAEWLAKRRESKAGKLAKAEKDRKGSAKKIKSGKEKKKTWNFTERAGVSFKSKKRYKRH